MKPLRINKPYTSDTRESEVSAGWHPEEINQLCTSDTRESELTAQWIADGINQVCTSEAGEGELTPEWNREETINCTPLTLGIVNSLLNETLNEINKLQRWHLGKWTHCWMKPWRKSINCATLTLGKVNSLLNETLMKSIYCAPRKIG